MPRSNLQTLSHYFHPPHQAYRAASLDLDFLSPSTLHHYIPTAKSVEILVQICKVLANGNNDRACALVAPYGSGKTSLLLVLSALLEANLEARPAIRKLLPRVQTLSTTAASLMKDVLKGSKGYVVVPVSGYQGNMRSTLLEGLKKALNRHRLRLTWTKLSKNPTATERDIVNLYQNASKELVQKGYKGLVLLYDEFGKILEAREGDMQTDDMLLLQAFAEQCARSGTHTLLLMIAMHQGFAQYAQRLPQQVKNEWTKIEGRFRLIHYIEDSIQVYDLIGESIQAMRRKIFSSDTKPIKTTIDHYTKISKDIRLFSALANNKRRRELFAATWPLHPLALYALPRFSSRVSQNERTLFHFLRGQDDTCFFSLLEKKAVTTSKMPLITIADLYPYFAALMSTDTGIGGTYKRYLAIKAALDRLKPDDEMGQNLIKTIGLISILEQKSEAAATAELLIFALEGALQRTQTTVGATLKALVAKKMLLYRKHSKEYRIWEGSDVDFVSMIRSEAAEIEATGQYLAVIKKMRAPYGFPYRHNEDVGVIRFYQGRFLTVAELKAEQQNLNDDRWVTTRDGLMLYILAETQQDIDDARKAASQVATPYVFIAIPRRPLAIRNIAAELVCIEQKLQDPTFLAEDPAIQKELSEYADDTLLALHRALEPFFIPTAEHLAWFHTGKEAPHIRNRLGLQRELSNNCDRLFSQTPSLQNEIINRRNPSASMVNARKKVLRAAITNYGKDHLGLTGHGPDVTIFRSIYLNTGLYAHDGMAWRFAKNRNISDKKLRNVMQAIHSFFTDSCSTNPHPIAQLVDKLRLPPYGLRDGILSLLLLAGFKSSQLSFTIMDDGIWQKEEPSAELYEAMICRGEKITIQCLALPAHQLAYLKQLQAVFGNPESQSKFDTDPVDTTIRKIYQWMHQLPECAKLSTAISREAQQFRQLLKSACDPMQLFFQDFVKLADGSVSENLSPLRQTPASTQLDLPEFSSEQSSFPFFPETNKPRYDIDTEMATQVITTITRLQCELTNVLASYQNDVAICTRKVFDLAEGGLPGLQEGLQKWVANLVPDLREYVEDVQCKGLLDRIESRYETDLKLVESLASLITGKSIAYWDDTYPKEQFEMGLRLVHAKLIRADILLAKRNGGDPEQAAKKQIADHALWNRIIDLSPEAKEQLGVYLLHTAQKKPHDG